MQLLKNEQTRLLLYRNLLVALLYVLSAKAGLLLAFEHTNSTAVWPPAGLALAAVLLWGQGIWPGIAAGAFIANVGSLAGLGFSPSFVLACALATAAGNTFEAVLGGRLVLRFTQGRNPFGRSEDTLKFILFGALCATAVGAIIGAITCSVLLNRWSDTPLVWLTRWIGDMTGALVLVPILLGWKDRSREWSSAKIGEGLGLLALVLFCGWFIFLREWIEMPYPFIPLIVWAAIRFGLFESALFILVVSGMAIVATARGNGPFVHSSLNASLLQLQGYIGIVSITTMLLAALVEERKRSMESARKKEFEYRSLFDNMMSSAAHCRMVFENGVPMDYEYLAVNPAFERMTGLKNVVNRRVSDVIPGYCRDNPDSLEMFGRVAATGEPARWEHYLAALDKWLSFSIYSPAHGQFVVLTRDITERKKAEETLRTASGYNRNLIEVSLDPLVTIGKDGKITDVNSSTEAVTGFTRSELIGTDFSSYFTDPEKARTGYEQVFRTGFVRDYPLDIEHRNGTITSVLYNASVYKDDVGNVIGVFAAARDITLRKQMEEALQKSEALIKNILETVDEGFVVVGKDYRIISANKAFCSKAGMTIDEAIGKHCYEVSHHRETPCFEAGEQCSVKRTFETGEHSAFLHTHYDTYGSTQYVDTKSYALRDATGTVESAIEICVDITEKKKLEDQYRQAQKMEAIGQLAGGVAHDFNNILSAIIGYGHLSLMKLTDDDPVRHYVDQILQSSERAAALTQSLLAFGRKQPTRKDLLSVDAVLGNFEKFLQRLLREDIEMTIRYSDEQPLIMADRGQVEQVIMNLVANARDAMPHKGRLSIATGISVMDEEFIRLHGYGRAGDYVVLSVIDTGVGMDEAVQKRIFEPFFTTKEMGKGTGLGLATVYGIVKAHQGFINVYSEPGKGTAFHVYFPLVRAKGSTPEPVGPVPALLQGGAETILLAEDDASLRTMTSVILRGMGYTVIAAEDGDQAVARFIENRAAVKLVILDGIMPKTNGLEAYREISALSPKIRCLFMSGYAGEMFAQEGLPTGTEFLSKPVKPSELLSKVREMLDQVPQEAKHEE